MQRKILMTILQSFVRVHQELKPPLETDGKGGGSHVSE